MKNLTIIFLFFAAILIGCDQKKDLVNPNPTTMCNPVNLSYRYLYR
jgi:hypothetical protein